VTVVAAVVAANVVNNPVADVVLPVTDHLYDVAPLGEASNCTTFPPQEEAEAGLTLTTGSEFTVILMDCEAKVPALSVISNV
jgi:hypothetical protein